LEHGREGEGGIPNYQQEKLYLEQWGRPKLSVRKKLIVNRNREERTLENSYQIFPFFRKKNTVSPQIFLKEDFSL
jgi:hypothetical protein